MPARIGISTRTAAAIAAAVVLLPLLVFVDLPAADAHPKTVRRCIVDPPISHCWDEPVSHYHPPPTTQKPIDPPDEQDLWGTTTTTAAPTTAAPPTTTIPDPPDEQDLWGTTTTTAAPTTTTTQPPQCYWPNHSHGNTCHGPHGSPPCGTGTWTPHSGHTPVQRPPSPTEPPKDDEDEHDGEEDGCISGTFVSGDCTPRQPDDGDGSSECPKLLGTHPHLDREQHRHLLLWGTMSDCHDATSGHQHTDGTRDTSGGGERYEGLNDILGQIGGLIRTGTEASLNAARAALNQIATDLGEDALRNAEANVHLGQEIEELWNRLPEPAQNMIVGLNCVGLVAIAAKSIVASGGATAPAWVKWAGGVTGAGVAIECQRRIMALIPDVPGNDGDDQSGDGDSADQQDDGRANSEAEPRTTTTAPPDAVGSVTGLGGSADGNSVWLGWNAPASGPTPTAYRVLRTASGGTEQEVARVGGNAYRDRNLQSGVTYTYRVQAVSGTLAGPISAPASVTIP